jgi:Argonaute siRNA chaperone (ARC) complex subunit Arb1
MITGFEEYYADPPMNADEATAEEAMYDIKFSVAAYELLMNEINRSRAEKVVQRYRAARRFNHDRERIFSAYLTFGGIRTVSLCHSRMSVIVGSQAVSRSRSKNVWDGRGFCCCICQRCCRRDCSKRH